MKEKKTKEQASTKTQGTAQYPKTYIPAIMPNEGISQDTFPQEILAIKNPKKRVFLEMFYASLGNIKRTCYATHINRATFYNWMNTDERFASLIKLQQQELNDEMKHTLIEMAIVTGKQIGRAHV